MPQTVNYRNMPPWTRRQKRVAGGIGALLLAAAAGALVWAQTHPGDYGASENGCVTVLTPSSLGGQVLHRCGAEAQSWCRAAYAANDRLARLAQPQCRLAGITPDPSPAASARPEPAPSG
jgi:hypothetical protein